MTTPGPLLVGRIVHYVSYGTPGGEFLPECRAAIVTRIAEFRNRETDVVGLAVFNPSGIFLNQDCPHADFSATGPVGGTWHWPHSPVS